MPSFTPAVAIAIAIGPTILIALYSPMCSSLPVSFLTCVKLKDNDSLNVISHGCEVYHILHMRQVTVSGEILKHTSLRTAIAFCI